MEIRYNIDVQGKVNIFNYDNYRKFLEDSYKAKKAVDRKFSFRFFAKAAGFSSSNFLKLVMQGKRNLTEDSIKKISKAFSLNKEEGEFFHYLTLFNQAKTVEMKRFYAQQLLGSRKLKKMFPLKLAQYEYYAKWYFILIRELVGIKGFKEDPKWIAEKIVPHISPLEATRAIEQLIILGLLKRDANGKLCQAEAHLTTPDEVTSSSVALFHREMMKRGSEAIDRFPREKREFSSITLPLTEEMARKIKEMIQNFRKGIVEIASEEQEAKDIYYVNFQLFPVTSLKDSENE